MIRRLQDFWRDAVRSRHAPTDYQRAAVKAQAEVFDLRRDLASAKKENETLREKLTARDADVALVEKRALEWSQRLLETEEELKATTSENFQLLLKIEEDKTSRLVGFAKKDKTIADLKATKARLGRIIEGLQVKLAWRREEAAKTIAAPAASTGDGNWEYNVLAVETPKDNTDKWAVLWFVRPETGGVESWAVHSYNMPEHIALSLVEDIAEAYPGRLVVAVSLAQAYAGSISSTVPAESRAEDP